LTAHRSRRTLDSPLHELIAAPLLGEYFVLRPGAVNGVKLPRAQYEELASAPTDMLLWHDQAAGWDVLAFEHIDGARHADYRPGSPDLPHVIDAPNAGREARRPRSV